MLGAALKGLVTALALLAFGHLAATGRVRAALDAIWIGFLAGSILVLLIGDAADSPLHLLREAVRRRLARQKGARR